MNKVITKSKAYLWKDKKGQITSTIGDLIKAKKIISFKSRIKEKWTILIQNSNKSSISNTLYNQE